MLFFLKYLCFQSSCSQVAHIRYNKMEAVTLNGCKHGYLQRAAWSLHSEHTRCPAVYLKGKDPQRQRENLSEEFRSQRNVPSLSSP